MKSAEIREAFLSFFQKRGHTIVSSDSLIPGNDPTLLFTNAGMVPFKDCFLGQEARPYVRATSSQRCVRAGGKHNDLDNVGYTARHHTFFEMLGNFSFGDYFKREAIQYAWQFLTETLQIPPEKLWITVYADDQEAADIWLNEIGVSTERFTRIGDKPGKKYESDNFWSMGDTGPCGPCSEIFYDHGSDVLGGPPGTPEEDGDRYVEIWNLVFMQYARASNGSIKPLPKPSVDTGMGLERLAAVMQNVRSNYEIDLFQHLIKATAATVVCDDLQNNSLKVISDHIRSAAFLILDGIVPSNEKRGYVLRRIIRRAIRHGYMLGCKQSFFYKLVAPLVREMGQAYPDLAQQQSQIENILKAEEERFSETVEHGMKMLEETMASMKAGDVIHGDLVFKLYDTYGFPVDLTADVARAAQITIDQVGFDKAMNQQRELARSASQFGVDYSTNLNIDASSEFCGYEALTLESEVIALYKDSQPAEKLNMGDDAIVVLKQTPFYAESGGQAGDVGLLIWKQGAFAVKDTQKQAEAILHIGTMTQGTLGLNATVRADVAAEHRHLTMQNHSATHLLHAALQQILGNHVVQKGSSVDAERLRFDFSHQHPVTVDELSEIETLVNTQIRQNTEVKTDVMSFDEASSSGAMALFGEKYSDKVRVLSIGEFSKELCGGTHVTRAGDIGLFKITLETGIASGVRRIEAIVGRAAIAKINADEQKLRQIAGLIKASRDDVEDKVHTILQRLRSLEKENEQLKGKLASQQGTDLTSNATDVAGIKVLAALLDGADPKGLRDTVDQLKNKLGSAAVVLATVNKGRVSLVAGVTPNCTEKIKAGELVNHVAMQVGGKGGGRPDMAQAGGSNPEALPVALDSVVEWLREKLN